MKHHEAHQILRRLVNGVNPVTGERLEREHVLREPLVRDALLTALNMLSPAAEADQGPWVKRNGAPHAGRPWTEEDNRELLHLMEQNIPLDEIARRIHRRERGIQNQLQYLSKAGQGSNRGKLWTRHEDDILKDMHANGCKLHDIANALCRTPYAIECRMEQLHLMELPGDRDDPDRSWTTEDQQRLLQLNQQGMSVRKMANLLRRTESGIEAKLFSVSKSGQASDKQES